MNEKLLRTRTLAIINLVLVAVLYACVLDLMAGGPVSSWIARASAEHAQRQVEDDAYRRWLQENK